MQSLGQQLQASIDSGANIAAVYVEKYRKLAIDKKRLEKKQANTSALVDQLVDTVHSQRSALQIMSGRLKEVEHQYFQLEQLYFQEQQDSQFYRKITENAQSLFSMLCNCDPMC